MFEFYVRKWGLSTMGLFWVKCQSVVLLTGVNQVSAGKMRWEWMSFLRIERDYTFCPQDMSVDVPKELGIIWFACFGLQNPLQIIIEEVA